MCTVRGEKVIPVIAISVEVGPGVTVTVPSELTEMPAGVSVAGSLMPMSTRTALGSTPYQNPSSSWPFSSWELLSSSVTVSGSR